MAKQSRRRRCPRCDRLTALSYCCGIDLGVRRRPWTMDKAKIRLVHILKARKGLDDDTYRLRLSAVGVDSCKLLGRDAFRAFLQGMAKLPDSPNWKNHPDSTGLRRARG